MYRTEKNENSTSIAVYCKQCQAWLNGPRQLEDHKIGKKHRKNVQKEKAAKEQQTAAAIKAKQPVFTEPEKTTEMWEWLESARKQKENENRARRRRSHKDRAPPEEAEAKGDHTLY